jgi:hypothetical protein
MWSYYAAAHKGVVLGIEIDVKQKDVVDVSKVGECSSRGAGGLRKPP